MGCFLQEGWANAGYFFSEGFYLLALCFSERKDSSLSTTALALEGLATRWQGDAAELAQTLSLSQECSSSSCFWAQ